MFVDGREAQGPSSDDGAQGPDVIGVDGPHQQLVSTLRTKLVVFRL